tara:strand:- start:1043 stop:1885 length:843 start_codon:yes stop_codon:yes gene_type:complete
MATKKATAKPAVKQTETIENIAAATAPVKEVQPKKPTWEIKDRTYILKGDTTPLRYILQARNSRRSPLLWFDEKTTEQKEIRYATNQNSVFVQEQKGESILGSIIFEDGTLFVPKEKQNLQKLLSLYHPSQGNKYIEFKPAVLAEEELDSLESELEAMIAAKNMDVDQAEAILRVEIGSAVSNMGSKELKRDLLLFAKNKPYLFLELANDENVPLRNFAIKATEEGIISLSQDQRYFTWAANGRKLMTVPFDENPYSAMAAFFKTDEGVEIYRSIEKKTA